MATKRSQKSSSKKPTPKKKVATKKAPPKKAPKAGAASASKPAAKARPKKTAAPKGGGAKAPAKKPKSGTHAKTSASKPKAPPANTRSALPVAAAVAGAVSKKSTSSDEDILSGKDIGELDENGDVISHDDALQPGTVEFREEEELDEDAEGPPSWWREDPSAIEGAGEESDSRANFDDSDEWSEDDEDWNASRRGSLDDVEESGESEDEGW